MLEGVIPNGSRIDRIKLERPFQHDGGHAWVARAPWRSIGDTADQPFRSTAGLYEDGVHLNHAHAPHADIRIWGRGTYSHYGSEIRFSTSDNSDPNVNGRRYEVDLNFDLAAWKAMELQTLCTVWDLHPQAAFFRARGGDRIPPPVFCNLALTNKCNLRCEICGSQKFLDETGVRRRNMDIGIFEAVADVLFPVMAQVEMNSLGDPLLHPQIGRILEVIGQHRCDIRLQTNGTLFTEQMIDLLSQHSGTVMLSLDAIGPRFDEVRRGGVWEKAEPGLRRFLAQRDPERLAVGVYPTLTRRTLQDALTVAEWAFAHDVDEVLFHRYIPIQNSFEEAPSPTELATLADRLRNWAARHNPPMALNLDGVLLHGHGQRRTVFAHPEKQRIARLSGGMMIPMDLSMASADPVKVCVAPDHYVEIGLGGQIAACCRAQDVTLGFATSVASFANAWFGRNYRAIRSSLRRDERLPFSLPNCEGCVADHAPGSLRMPAEDYSRGGLGLDYSDWDELPLDTIQKESGFCYVALVPPGVALADYTLFEDGLPLGPGETLHDEIRQNGAGRYSLWGRSVYFSASDNSDARSNDRQYMLRRHLGLMLEIGC